MLQTVQQAVSRPKPGLNAEDLFTKGSGGISSDLRTLCPLLLALGLDHLGSSYRMAREEVCPGRRRKKGQDYKQGPRAQSKKPGEHGLPSTKSSMLLKQAVTWASLSAQAERSRSNSARRLVSAVSAFCWAALRASACSASWATRRSRSSASLSHSASLPRRAV